MEWSDVERLREQCDVNLSQESREHGGSDQARERRRGEERLEAEKERGAIWNPNDPCGLF